MLGAIFNWAYFCSNWQKKLRILRMTKDKGNAIKVSHVLKGDGNVMTSTSMAVIEPY